ncbi:hypothetical protein RJZ56_005406 [Blastomyces dermatitidis]|nr:uncharacterized protein BDCG_17387 [Blastomyces dermatitidis ER-3]KMW69440.1 hypothetical protein BDDG_13587 [Blastomyces dermatitidis ATCC 18188]OAT02102.1 hypothetical protein BDCG_17387 [Blastomyces dermatitidis ER-3]
MEATAETAPASTSSHSFIRSLNLDRLCGERNSKEQALKSQMINNNGDEPYTGRIMRFPANRNRDVMD